MPINDHAAAAIVDAFHQTANLRRSDIFPDGKLTPLIASEDAATAAPGWVGRSWSNGTLLVGINPGGGGDRYRRNPTDDQLYSLARTFRDATTELEKAEHFLALSAKWIDIQRTHSIWRIIDLIMKATQEQADEIAFLNILPFRTRMDALPSRAILQVAWDRAAQPQIWALRPKRIIALGKKAWNVMSRFALPPGTELILFKRGIGDSYIPDESKAVLMRLAEALATNP